MDAGDNRGLLGIMLFVHSNMGGTRCALFARFGCARLLTLASPSLVLRYPPILRASVSPETMEAFKLRDAGEGNAAALGADSEPYSFPSVNMAGFVPVNERSLLGSKVDIRVNDTAFLGLPTVLREDAGADDGDGDGDGAAHVRTDSPAPPSPRAEHTLAASVASTASLLRSDNSIADLAEVASSPARPSDSAEVLHESKLRLSSFNVVMAVRWHRVSKIRMEMFHNIIEQITTAYKREELRTSYLTKQCLTMLRVREAWLRAQSTEPVGARPGHAELAANLQASSTLACEIKDMYEGLATSGLAFVTVASWVTLSLSLCSTSHYPAYPIRPYQTLLLTNPQLVRADASEAIQRFVGAAKPSRSFQGVDALLLLLLLLLLPFVFVWFSRLDRFANGAQHAPFAHLPYRGALGLLAHWQDCVHHDDNQRVHHQPASDHHGAHAGFV